MNALRRGEPEPTGRGEMIESGIKWLRQGDLSRAEETFRQALSHDPGCMDARFQLCNLLQLRGQVAQAIEQYQTILKGNPGCVPVLLNLGHAYRKIKRYEDAETCYRQIASIDPYHSEALFFLAAVSLDRGQVEPAIKQLLVLTRRYPEFVDARFKLGIAYKRSGQLNDAIASFHAALKINPRLPQVYNYLGIINKTKGNYTLSEKHYCEALNIDPNLHFVHNNLGTLFHETGRYADAIASYKKALSFCNNSLQVLHNLGNTFQSMGIYHEAIECYRRAIAIDPDSASAYYHCGIAFKNIGNSKTAISFFEKALSIRPDWDKAVCELYHQLQQVCDWQRLLELDPVLDKITDSAFKLKKKPAENPFLSIVRKQNLPDNFAIAQAWSNDISQRISTSGPRYRQYRHPSSGQPLTIGYVSNRFRNAATAHLMRGLFSAHDRNQFKIYCYTYGQDDGSSYRKQIKAASDAFVNVSSMGHTEAADRIFDDGVNILIDLKGYTRNNRLKMFALRPAPIQVSYMGFTGTTGSDFLDYIIVDRTVVSEHDACHYSEQPVFMPHCYLVNDNTKTIAPRKWTRTDFGLPEDAFVFCSFNMPYKIDLNIFNQWMAILNAVPNSVLWLLHGDSIYEEKLRQEAIIRGVNASRIVFTRKLSIEEHLSRHQLADLALDTHMVNGHTTTSDALWAGIPVLTVRGGHFMSRVSASLLKAVNMEMLIAGDRMEYMEIATDLANNPDRLVGLKKRLFRNLRIEPLFDTRRFSKNLEYAYRTMWSNYLGGLTPRPIHVPDLLCSGDGR